MRRSKKKEALKNKHSKKHKAILLVTILSGCLITGTLFLYTSNLTQQLTGSLNLHIKAPTLASPAKNTIILIKENKKQQLEDLVYVNTECLDSNSIVSLEKQLHQLQIKHHRNQHTLNGCKQVIIGPFRDYRSTQRAQMIVGKLINAKTTITLGN